jgi:hypothetical protein
VGAGRRRRGTGRRRAGEGLGRKRGELTCSWSKRATTPAPSAGAQVKYISHREEKLPDGRRRELYGIGARYKALRGDEKAIRKLLIEDGRGLRHPAYFRFIFTVDNPTAERFARLDGHLAERVIRDSVEKTFRGAGRGLQGVFAVHQHGGRNRPAHPHVHALLSPRFENGKPVHISPVRIQRIKERWHTEVLRGLERQEQRLARLREMRTPIEMLRQPKRELLERPFSIATAKRPRSGRTLDLGLGRVRRVFRFTERTAFWARQWLRFGRRPAVWPRNAERSARRTTFRLASRAIPTPLREALWLTRGLRNLGLRLR